MWRPFRAVLLAVAVWVGGSIDDTRAQPQSDSAKLYLDRCDQFDRANNESHCKTRIQQNLWPCENLPYTTTRSVNKCIELFDTRERFAQIFGPARASAEGASAQKSAADGSASVPAVDGSTLQAPLAAASGAAETKSSPLELPLVVNRGPTASERRIVELQRKLEDAKNNAALTESLRQELADAEARAVREREEALQNEKKARDDAAVKAQELEATEAARKKQAQLLLYLMVGGGALIVVIGGMSWYMLRRQSERRHLAEREAKVERQRSERILKNRPPPFRDCLLDGGDAMSFKLLGNLLPEQAGGVVIGRHPDHAQVVIDRPEISRRHARFLVRNDEILIEDLGSANGTRVNGEPLRAGERRTLVPGSRVEFGPFIFTLVVSGVAR